jgi:putative addiction module component (TIGR02574 family)
MSTVPQHPEYRQLSVTDRLKLVEDVWDSIVDEQEQLPLSDEHKAGLIGDWHRLNRTPIK